MFPSLIMLSYSKSVLAMDSKSLDNNYMSCTICNQYVTTNILHNTYSIQTFSATNNKYSKHLLSACNIPSHPKTFLFWSKISLSINVVTPKYPWWSCSKTDIYYLLVSYSFQDLFCEKLMAHYQFLFFGICKLS